MHFLLYLFIYFYTLPPYNLSPMLPRPHPPSQTQKSRLGDSIESPSREYLAFIFRGLYFQFRPPGVQDDIQDKMEHNPYHDVDAQDIRDVDIPY